MEKEKVNKKKKELKFMISATGIIAFILLLSGLTIIIEQVNWKVALGVFSIYVANIVYTKNTMHRFLIDLEEFVKSGPDE